MTKSKNSPQGKQALVSPLYLILLLSLLPLSQAIGYVEINNFSGEQQFYNQYLNQVNFSIKETKVFNRINWIVNVTWIVGTTSVYYMNETVLYQGNNRLRFNWSDEQKDTNFLDNASIYFRINASAYENVTVTLYFNHKTSTPEAGYYVDNTGAPRADMIIYYDTGDNISAWSINSNLEQRYDSGNPGGYYGIPPSAYGGIGQGLFKSINVSNTRTKINVDLFNKMRYILY
jgi:hypothetical protein